MSYAVAIGGWQQTATVGAGLKPALGWISKERAGLKPAPTLHRAAILADAIILRHFIAGNVSDRASGTNSRR